MMNALRTLRFIARHPLNRNEPFKALQRFMAWQLAARLRHGAVAVPFVGDTRLLVSRGMNGATGNVYCGLHEFEDMAFVLHALRADDLFVDVGANIGSYSVLAAGAVGARTIAFEPAPRAFECLLDNLRLNDLGSLVDARNEGVGAQHGHQRFTTHLDTVNHVVTDAEPAGASVDVPITTLDAAIGASAARMIKVDVEGYETAVIDGGEQTFASPSLMAVLMELNGSGSRYGFDERQLHGRMVDFGLQPARYEPMTRQLHPVSYPFPGNGNGLYVRDLGVVQARVASAPRRRVHGTEV
jgi:FkbM family methyltransferase